MKTDHPSYAQCDQLIQIRMTERQFAKFVTGLNTFDGAPCTVERLDGRSIDSPPFESEKQIARAEFDELIHQISESLNLAKQRLAQLTTPGVKVSKADLSNLRSEIDRAATDIKSNLPYVIQCFNETLDRRTDEN
jgi:hypothetical protein